MGNKVPNVMKVAKNRTPFDEMKLEIQLSDDRSIKNMEKRMQILKNLGARLDQEIPDVDGGYYDFEINVGGRQIDFCYHMNTWVGQKIFVEKPEEQTLLMKFLEDHKLIDANLREKPNGPKE